MLDAKESVTKPCKKDFQVSSLMVWAMVMPNGFLYYEIMNGKQKSTNYINIIKTKALPIIKVNIKDNYMFQQDNCQYINQRQSGVALLDWPPYSPDQNIIENIWAMLSADVYDRGSIKNLKKLANRIEDSISDLNETKVMKVLELNNSMLSRLCSVLCHVRRINY